jgi:uracil-DNA glycosylase family 4
MHDKHYLIPEVKSMKKEKLKKLYNKITELTKEPYITGVGNVDAEILLVGEAPGAKEIELGKPFVGQAGKILDGFLDILEIQREDLFITNVVKTRPFRINEKTGKKNNRPPTQNEIDAFFNILYEEINIICPKIIIPLGNTPLRCIMNDNTLTIGNAHGKLSKKDNFLIFPLYHPAATIHNQNLKGTYLVDLDKLKRVISSI